MGLNHGLESQIVAIYSNSNKYPRLPIYGSYCTPLLTAAPHIRGNIRGTAKKSTKIVNMNVENRRTKIVGDNSWVLLTEF